MGRPNLSPIQAIAQLAADCVVVEVSFHFGRRFRWALKKLTYTEMCEVQEGGTPAGGVTLARPQLDKIGYTGQALAS